MFKAILSLFGFIGNPKPTKDRSSDLITKFGSNFFSIKYGYLEIVKLRKRLNYSTSPEAQIKWREAVKEAIRKGVTYKLEVVNNEVHTHGWYEDPISPKENENSYKRMINEYEEILLEALVNMNSNLKEYYDLKENPATKAEDIKYAEIVMGEIIKFLQSIRVSDGYMLEDLEYIIKLLNSQ